MREWAKIVSADGLRPGDAADALASYWVLNWAMAHHRDNDRAEALAARDQVRTTMAQSPVYARLTEPQRQDAGTLMLDFLLQQAVYVDARKRGDQPLLRKLGDAAVARFRSEMDVDLRQLTLTPKGFVAE